MKTLLTLTLIATLFAIEAFANAGPGPWASGAYYPGGADGKYQAAVYGNNITGVIGFAIREGGPTVLQTTNSTTSTTGGAGAGSAAAATIAAATSTTQIFDETQNYFVIFVEGRTYSGLAVGSVNPVGKTVTGALLGAQPDFGFVTNDLPFEFPEQTFRTNVVVTNTTLPTNRLTTNITTVLVPTNTFITNLTTVTVPTNSLLTNTTVTTFLSPTNSLLTNSTVAVIGFTPQYSITNLPGITITNVTNQTIRVTNNGVVTTTNILISNVVTTDPTVFVITNQVPIFQTNFTVVNVPANQTAYLTNTTVAVTGGSTLVYVTNTNPVAANILTYVTNITPVDSTYAVLVTNTNVVANDLAFSVEGIQATTNTFDPLPILNRGLSGGFRAKLKNNQAYMTFRGDGELSTPSQLQTVDLATNASGDTISGTIETHTVPFKVDGLRTSFLTTLAPSSGTTGSR